MSVPLALLRQWHRRTGRAALFQVDVSERTDVARCESMCGLHRFTANE
jgi:hypothetical protein